MILTVDGYIEKYNICVKWDEITHRYNKKNDIIRERFLTETFQYIFFRIDEKKFLEDVETGISSIVNAISEMINSIECDGK
jgi:very-short-patch-repair endonuclease